MGCNHRLKLEAFANGNQEISKSNLKVGMDVSVRLVEKKNALMLGFQLPNSRYCENIKGDRYQLSLAATEVVDAPYVFSGG